MINKILAAFSLYTRLPLWKIKTLGQEDYEKAINFWPIIGVFTGGVLAVCYACAFFVFKNSILAILMALVVRILCTGAFHEDGLGDLFDGFGGGQTKEKRLAIMKDSCVGNYAVIGYILYYLIYVSTIQSSIPLSINQVMMVLFLSDIMGKTMSSLQVVVLPYARKEEDSKIGVVYQSKSIVLQIIYMGAIAIISIILFPTVPIIIWFIGICLLTTLLIYYVKKKIDGYTGDTCGALSLIIELVSVIILTFLLPYFI